MINDFAKNFAKKIAQAYKDQFDKEDKLEHVSYSLDEEFKIEPDTIQMEWDEESESFKNKRR